MPPMRSRPATIRRNDGWLGLYFDGRQSRPEQRCAGGTVSAVVDDCARNSTRQRRGGGEASLIV